MRELDATAFNRLRLPHDTRGVLITRVDPMSATFDADVQRGTVLLEINRKPILSVVRLQPHRREPCGRATCSPCTSTHPTPVSAS